MISVKSQTAALTPRPPLPPAGEGEADGGMPTLFNILKAGLVPSRTRLRFCFLNDPLQEALHVADAVGGA